MRCRADGSCSGSVPRGPRVVEGWYGVPYGRPLARTREYIDIIRQVAAREAPLVHRGQDYRIPYDGPDATGLGVPMKSILHADRALEDLHRRSDAEGHRLRGGNCRRRVPDLDEPRAARADRASHRGGFRQGGRRPRPRPRSTSRPWCPCPSATDLERARQPVREHMALYIGGMGPRGRNFYNDYTRRMGYEEAAARIQDLYLAGDRAGGRRGRAGGAAGRGGPDRAGGSHSRSARGVEGGRPSRACRLAAGRRVLHRGLRLLAEELL